MKLSKKVAAGLLLTIGVSIVLLTVAHLLNKDAQNKEGAALILCLLGLPATAVGGWLASKVYGQVPPEKVSRDRETEDRLQTIFLQLIQERNGQISVLHFAMEAQLSGEEAKQFLDEKAKELKGKLDLGEQGDVCYRFKV